VVRIRERVTYIRKMHKTIHYNAQFEVFKTMLPNIPPTSVQQTLLFFLVFVKLTSSPETSFCHLSQPLQTNIGVARGGPKGPCPPQIFRNYSHFVLREAFFQTKYCYSPTITHFGPRQIFGLATPLQTNITETECRYSPWSNIALPCLSTRHNKRLPFDEVQ